MFKYLTNILKKNKCNILNVIFSFFTWHSLITYMNSSFYNIVSILMFIALLYFYNNVNKQYTKKEKIYSIILSVLFSIILSIGNITINNSTINNIGYLNYKNIIKIFIMILGFIPLLYRLFNILFKISNKVKIIDNKRKDKIDYKKFILIFLIIFCGWFILFLRFFPAIMTPDSYYVIHNVTNNILSDHHTFGHTWFFGAFFHIGKLLFSSVYGGIAFYTIAQMCLMDLMFTYVISYFYNRKLKKSIIYILVLFVTLNPLFSHYSVTLWRDVLFGMSFLIIFLCLYKYVISKFKITILDTILFTISIIILLFFRNNGIYVLIFLTPFLIFIGNKKIIKAIYLISIIIIYFVIKSPIFDYFNVEKGLEREAYSIPIQQISRVVASNKTISDKNYKVLSKLYDVNRAKTEYNPTISDKMKETINGDYLKENKSEFLKTWFNLLKKYPSIYFEAYFTQTLGYWHPDVKYWATAGESVSIFDSEIHSNPLLPEWLCSLIDKTTSRKIPFSIFIWSIGLNFAILVISTFLTIYKKNKNHLLYYVPFYALWLTMMLATPVYAELRYIFGLFVTIPFIIIVPFLND